jgi:ribonuclease III
MAVTLRGRGIGRRVVPLRTGEVQANQTSLSLARALRRLPFFTPPAGMDPFRRADPGKSAHFRFSPLAQNADGLQAVASASGPITRTKKEVVTLATKRTLEARLGVKFKNPALLREALVHSSYVNENPHKADESNERLEFLGDAVLGLVVADELFNAYPELDEGKLTELRTHLVRRDTIAKAGRHLGLGDSLLLGRGEEAGGGRRRPTNLAHVYEAIVGAVFLDRGLASARRFVRRSLEAEFELAADRAFPSDPKSRLQEISQSRYQSTPLYSLLKAEGPDHARKFTIEVVVDGRALGSGSGNNKQEAEKEAAAEALARLEKEKGKGKK